LRYSWGALIIVASVGAGLLGPAPLGLYCVGFALVLVLAVVRRWIWAEDSRDAFLIERSDRGKAQRISLQEDLRDEALVGLTCLFVLIPLGLRQIQLATGNSAFELHDQVPDGPIGQFLAWLGYFGAELAKSVPFVDWSEVFHVANDSPIKPKTTLGAQVVFGMRAALDLLLLAAVVKAVQVAGRLRDQEFAFRHSRLPILEPFAEARELRRAGLGIEDALALPPSEQHAIASFPAYDAGRLRELVLGDSADGDPLARKTAVALLACQHVGGETDRFFTEVVSNQPDPEMRLWVLTVASGLAPEADPRRRDADRARLKALLADRSEALPVRASAARALGRMGHDDATTDLLLERLRDRREDRVVRADAGVALAKLQPAEASAPVSDLVSLFEGSLDGDWLIAAMATACALARLAPDLVGHDVAERFDAPLRQHVLRAARIQPKPMDIAAAREREPGAHLDQLVRIAPGEDPFQRTFQMGSSDEDDQAYSDERPPREITMQRPFALGRYPVTQAPSRARSRPGRPMRSGSAPTACRPGHSSTKCRSRGWHPASAR
jgi:hypothetical protein